MAEEQVQDTQVDEVVLKEAKSLGWVPKEEFRGAEDDWIDAPTFVERGRQILPIVQSNNKRLQGQVNNMQSQLASTQAALQAANAAIEALEAAHEEDTKEQVDAARAELRKELAAASRDGDHDTVAELTDKLSQLNNADKGGTGDKGTKSDADKPPAPKIHPEVQTWMQSNPEFMQSSRHVALANVVATEMRQAGETTVGAAFMDLVAAEVEKTLGVKRPGFSKVGSGGGGSSRREGSGTGAQTYADLPPEAKAACDRMEKRLVGQNRKHKDQASWRKSYTAEYFRGDK